MLNKILKSVFKKREQASRRNSDTDEDGELVKPFLDHLEDLRWMFIKMLGTLCIAMTVAFGFRTQLAAIMEYPLFRAVGDVHLVLISTNPIGSISASFTLAFYAGIVVSFPLLSYFLAEFVLPALTRKEKRFIVPGVLVGFVLFLAGVALSYFFVLPPMFRWLYWDAINMGIKPSWTINEYYQIVTHICIAVGLICEMPVVVVILNGIGLMSARWLSSMRMYGYFVSLVVAVIVAPTTDLFMLFLFALPIMALFEICIWIVYYFEKRREKRERLAASKSEIDPNEPID
jgi:sec-independent protein translocase protein TatC